MEKNMHIYIISDCRQFQDEDEFGDFDTDEELLFDYVLDPEPRSSGPEGKPQSKEKQHKINFATE